MKILVLDEFLCYPVDSGKKVRTYNLLRHLAAKHSITLLAFTWGDPRERSGIDQLTSLGIKVVTVPRRDPRKSGAAFYLRLFANLFSRHPYIVDGHLLPAYRNRLEKLVAELKPDLLLAEWSPYAAYLKDFEGIPRVAVAHNLEQNIWRGYWEMAESWPKQTYIGLQYRKVVKFENDIFHWLDGLIAVSPLEQEQVRQSHPKLKVALIDNGVDTEYFCPSNLPIDPNLVSFTGSMDWRPNQDGVEYFIRAILPQLRRRIANVKVVVIGRQPPQWLVDLGAEHGVTFTGSVDDVRPDVYRSAVSIVPLRIGGGSRLKILEALAMEKAVVSTTLGAEGLRVRDGEHITIADDPEVFANAVAELLQKQTMREQFGKAGRLLVTEHYRWERLAERQSAFMESLANG